MQGFDFCMSVLELLLYIRRAFPAMTSERQNGVFPLATSQRDVIFRQWKRFVLTFTGRWESSLRDRDTRCTHHTRAMSLQIDQHQ